MCVVRLVYVMIWDGYKHKITSWRETIIDRNFLLRSFLNDHSSIVHHVPRHKMKQWLVDEDIWHAVCNINIATAMNTVFLGKHVYIFCVFTLWCKIVEC